MLPFPFECKENIFGKLPEVKRKPDISCMTTTKLNKFRNQCRNIENRIKPVYFDEDEEELFQYKDFNEIKLDEASFLGSMHVNIASLDAHIDDLGLIFFDIIVISVH